MSDLETIESSYKARVYGSCCGCSVQFNYGETYFTITANKCYFSQGYPDVFQISEKQYCHKCLKRIINDKSIDTHIP